METANPHGNEWVPRELDLPELLAKRSHFLLGPRQTGKSSLIRHALTKVRVYDLLDASLYLALSQNPGRLAQELGPQDHIVVIDEIQRLPVLLNEVHRLIETRGTRFPAYGIERQKTPAWRRQSARWSRPDQISSSAYLERVGRSVRPIPRIGTGSAPLSLFLGRPARRPSGVRRHVSAGNYGRRRHAQCSRLQPLSESRRALQRNHRKLHQCGQ